MFHSALGLRYRGTNPSIQTEVAHLKAKDKLSDTLETEMKDLGEKELQLQSFSGKPQRIEDSKAYNAPLPGAKVSYSPGTAPSFFDELLKNKVSFLKLAKVLQNEYSKQSAAEQQYISGIANKVAGYHVAKLAMTLFGIGPIPLTILAILMKAQVASANQDFTIFPGLPAGASSICSPPFPECSNQRYCDDFFAANSTAASKDNALVAHSMIWREYSGITAASDCPVYTTPYQFQECLRAIYGSNQGLQPLIQSIIQQPDFSIENGEACTLYYTPGRFDVSQSMTAGYQGVVSIDNLSRSHCNTLSSLAQNCLSSLQTEVKSFQSINKIILGVFVSLAGAFASYKAYTCVKNRQPARTSPSILVNNIPSESYGTSDTVDARQSDVELGQSSSEPEGDLKAVAVADARTVSSDATKEPESAAEETSTALGIEEDQERSKTSARP